MSFMENIIICSLFLSAFFVIIKNTALLTSLYQKSGSNNSKTLQKQGFVYSLKPVPRNRLNYTTLNHIIIITIQNPIRKTTANAA